MGYKGDVGRLEGLTFWREDNYIVDCGKVAEQLVSSYINILKLSSLIRNSSQNPLSFLNHKKSLKHFYFIAAN